MIVSQDSLPAERRAFTLKEVAGKCGRSYHTIYRAVLRGDLKVLSGFVRAMVSSQELERFLNKSEVYRSNTRHTRKATTKEDQGEVALPA